ncbi:MAG: low temperature requirement protein A [Cryobacterium sp.]|nr:low temperature requirement protein A [Cryobacterium sp.]MBX3089474.1 low temperature requirement protein A [Cryobacterium sp.]MCO5294739.1 low temperature requirement protein A [Homoserinimonas sp.]
MEVAIRSLLRPSKGEDAHRVSYAELFFDLVFVFAVTQVSHLLIGNHTIYAVLQAIMIGAIVWWVWVYTAWVTNWLNPEANPIRVLLLLLMIVGVVLSASIPRAFGESALLFAVALVVFQVGRSLAAVAAFAKEKPGHALNFVRIAIWLAASGVLWILGALFPDARLWIWLLALVIDYAGPRARFWTPGLGRSPLETWDVAGAHMAERMSLFIIIALGETVVVSASAFASLELNWSTGINFLCAFTGSVLMWFLYFSRSERAGSRYIDAAEERGMIAQTAYTYVPLLMVLGIVLSAVVDHFLLDEPLKADFFTAMLLGLSCALFLVGSALFRAATGFRLPLFHVVGAICALGLIFLGSLVPVITLAWLANGIMLIVLIFDLTKKGEPD